MSCFSRIFKKNLENGKINFCLDLRRPSFQFPVLKEDWRQHCVILDFSRKKGSLFISYISYRTPVFTFTPKPIPASRQCFKPCYKNNHLDWIKVVMITILVLTASKGSSTFEFIQGEYFQSARILIKHWRYFSQKQTNKNYRKWKIPRLEFNNKKFQF